MPSPRLAPPARRERNRAVLVAAAVIAVVAWACSSSGSSDSSTSATSTTTSSTTSTSGGTSTSTAAGFRQATWGSNVTITYGDGYIEYKSNGIPDHARQAEYALPKGGVVVPSAATAYAGPDPTATQSYDFKITTSPTKATSPTSTSLGTIGVMISGAALFNPYEGDASTVATASNFTVKDSSGNDVAFLDSCNGHPTPMGAYHYHALPSCVTAKVDTANGPSHIIGIGFDGYPIYGNRAMDGTKITAAQLDSCNGITSATPEFPDGIYHYVLLDTADSTSSIRCFAGTVASSVSQMAGMPGMSHQ
jgi:YHYH protein